MGYGPFAFIWGARVASPMSTTPHSHSIIED